MSGGVADRGAGSRARPSYGAAAEPDRGECHDGQPEEKRPSGWPIGPQERPSPIQERSGRFSEGRTRQKENRAVQKERRGRAALPIAFRQRNEPDQQAELRDQPENDEAASMPEVSQGFASGEEEEGDDRFPPVPGRRATRLILFKEVAEEWLAPSARHESLQQPRRQAGRLSHGHAG